MGYGDRSVRLNDLDLNKFHVFRIVAESSSMREAGERLLRTPSAVSQSVTSLEKSLGIKLFTRSGTKLELTAAGRRILRQVSNNESYLLELLDAVRGDSFKIGGQVTLGLPHGYPALSMPEALSGALTRHLDLQLRLRFFSHAELADALFRGKLDIALSLQPLRRWNRVLQSTQHREESLVLAVPHRFRSLCSGKVTELPIIDYYQKPLLIDGWLKHHRQSQVRTSVRVFASNLDHALQMVLRGVGCAVVPRHVIADEIITGTLLEHNLDKRSPWITGVWLNSMRSPAALSPSAREIWEAFLQ